MPITRSPPAKAHAPGASPTLRSESPFSALLSASWERSIKHGLRRQDRLVFNNTVSAAAEKRVREDNRALVTHANPEMVRLYQGLGSARWLTLCTNVRGELVSFVGDHSAAPRQLRVLMHPGRMLHEAEIGTTAVGCALQEQRAIIVSRGEHFLLELQHLFCAGAPIQGPDGRLAGALDLTGFDVRALPLVNDLVNVAVRRIENSMLCGVDNCTLLRFHCDERLLGTPFEAMLAVSADGKISAANRAARQVLSLYAQCGIGVAFEYVFDCSLQELHKRIDGAHGRPIRINSDAGSFAFLAIEREIPSRSVSGAGSAHTRGGDLSGGSAIVEDAAVMATYRSAARVLRNGLPVILQGETGTGKELFARALHQATRPQTPFVAVNCAAIPEEMIEPVLFGHAEGAHLDGRRGGAAGVIEQAHNGVLLLDEIGDMPDSLQRRLLRVVQSRAVTRIGDNKEVAVDISIICATHRDLDALVAERLFREDLYHRLNGYTVRLPPLRERADIAAIVMGLLRRWSGGRQDSGSSPDQLITPAALTQLVSYAWPGNIRQLEQAIRSMLALRAGTAALDVADLPAFIKVSPSGEMAAGDRANRRIDAIEIDAIRKALHEHGGNVSVAARVLGISRGTIYNKLKRFGLSAQHESRAGA